MLHVALWEPEIPPNTGTIARLCIAVACPLHLIGQPGFRLNDKTLKRAGLDYWHEVDLHRHDCLADFEQFTRLHDIRVLCLSAHATLPYTQIAFQGNDCLLFGSETRGLPPEVLERYHDRCFTIPMPSGKVRSLNLAVATGIVVYEGLRQLHAW